MNILPITYFFVHKMVWRNIQNTKIPIWHLLLVYHLTNNNSGNHPNVGIYLVSLHTLSGRIGKVVASHAEGCNATLHVRIPAVAELHRFILCTRRSGGNAHDGGRCDQSIDLPSLTPLSVAGFGRLQLGVRHWATSVITASSW